MKLSDLPAFPPSWRGFIPGLEAASQVLMKAWLDAHQTQVRAMYYNVHLYQDPASLPDLPVQEANLWQDLSALRIDALAATLDGVLLIEVSPYVTAATFGRILLYQAKYPKQFPTDPLRAALLVYQFDNPTILAALQAQGVNVEMVSPKAGAVGTSPATAGQ